MIRFVSPIPKPPYTLFQITFGLILGIHSRCYRGSRECLADKDTQMLWEAAECVIISLEICGSVQVVKSHEPYPFGMRRISRGT